MTRHTPLIWAALALLSACPEPEPETDPVLTGASLTPVDAVESSVLTCTPETNSPDTDVEAMSLAYTWVVGSTTVSEATTDTLDGQTFDAGDDVTCRITPNDGDPVDSNTVTIGNTAPVLESVTVSPTMAYTNTVLTAEASATDEDSADSLSYTFTWFSGDTALSATGNTLDGTTSFEKGERISVQVVANDGTDDSAPLTSSSVLILNTPPGAPGILITPAAPQSGIHDLLCQVETPSIDEDDDAITYTMEWTVNSIVYSGTPSTTHYTGDTILGSETAEGDVWECTVTPDDGEEQGVAAKASVTTGCLGLDCAGLLTGEGADDNAGFSVASAGDVNGDGYDDILIGAHDEETRGRKSGAAYLIYGSSTGISGMSLAKADAKFTGEAPGDKAGASVASAGDVNGDGYSDLLVGAHSADAFYPSDSEKDYAGVTYLIYGSSTGISNMDLADADAIFTGETPADYSGYSVSSAGDVNNDGYDDVLVGAVPVAGFSGTAPNDNGAVYLIYGSSTGISDMSLDSADARLSGVSYGDRAGWAVSAAQDIDADGYADLLVGATYSDDGGSQSGTVYLVLGAGTRLSDMTLASADATLTGIAAGDYAGQSVSSAGDVNNDGYSDVIVGAPGSASNTGETYIVLGSKSGISDMTLASADATLAGIAAGDNAGHSVSSAGDVNNDGYSDVLVGAYGAKNMKVNVGAAYLVLGSSSGIADMTLTSADAVLNGLNARDFTGVAVSSAGDVNNDGYSDVLVGAYLESTAGAEAGAVYLLHGWAW